MAILVCWVTGWGDGGIIEGNRWLLTERQSDDKRAITLTHWIIRGKPETRWLLKRENTRLTAARLSVVMAIRGARGCGIVSFVVVDSWIRGFVQMHTAVIEV
jgi:hypothetical protein